jgi:hypothetical protein
MNAIQGVIDWTTVVHTSENNAASEAHLEANRFKFTGQCAVVFSLLQKGKRLTCKSAMNDYGIGHLPRRIADLKAAGMNILDHWLTDNEGKKICKEYFIA